MKVKAKKTKAQFPLDPVWVAETSSRDRHGRSDDMKTGRRGKR
jgi:hypothetical protein